MNPYDQAHALARSLKESEEYREFSRLKEVAYEDATNKALLDEYNLFLYHGQGKQIKAMRAARKMTQAEYARRLGVPIGNLKQWEIDRVKIFKSTWERIMLRG